MKRQKKLEPVENENLETVSPEDLMGLTAEVVSAYVSNNPLDPGALIKLIGEVHMALRATNDNEMIDSHETPMPAVPISSSVDDEYIICLEDGKRFKSLKRHLRTRYGLTPEQYREKWKLPPDYPMVAPSYTKERSALAKKMGLGQRRSSQ